MSHLLQFPSTARPDVDEVNPDNEVLTLYNEIVGSDNPTMMRVVAHSRELGLTREMTIAMATLPLILQNPILQGHILEIISELPGAAYFHPTAVAVSSVGLHQ